MKTPKNVVIVFDISTNEYRIIETKNRRCIIKTILEKVENEHDIKISSADFESALPM